MLHGFSLTCYAIMLSYMPWAFETAESSLACSTSRPGCVHRPSTTNRHATSTPMRSECSVSAITWALYRCAATYHPPEFGIPKTNFASVRITMTGLRLICVAAAIVDDHGYIPTYQKSLAYSYLTGFLGTFVQLWRCSRRPLA